MQLPANDVPNYGNTFAQASTTLFTSTCYDSPIAIREERNTVFNQATNGKKMKPHSYWLNRMKSCELPILN